MAAGMLSAPGTKYGPCESECQHTDCAFSRATAESICHWCGKKIGYDTRMYFLEDSYVHAVCLETENEESK